MPAQVSLNKVSLSYSAVEDRMRMTGDVSDSDPLVFWLTRRMCEKLVKAVSDFIEKSSSIPVGADKDLMLSFRQSAALIRKEKTEPVTAGSDAQVILVQKVDLKFHKESVVLAFFMSETDSANLSLSIQNARQWLGVLYAQYQAAAWPLDGWPAWATESNEKPVSPSQRKQMH